PVDRGRGGQQRELKIRHIVGALRRTASGECSPNQRQQCQRDQYRDTAENVRRVGLKFGRQQVRECLHGRLSSRAKRMPRLPSIMSAVSVDARLTDEDRSMYLLVTVLALGAPPTDDWKSQESAHLRNVQQVTADFVRAGEGYFSPDGRKIIFQAE